MACTARPVEIRSGERPDGWWGKKRRGALCLLGRDTSHGTGRLKSRPLQHGRRAFLVHAPRASMTRLHAGSISTVSGSVMYPNMPSAFWASASASVAPPARNEPREMHRRRPSRGSPSSEATARSAAAGTHTSGSARQPCGQGTRTSGCRRRSRPCSTATRCRQAHPLPAPRMGDCGAGASRRGHHCAVVEPQNPST